MIIPGFASRQFGLYRFENAADGTMPFNAALRFGTGENFHEKIITSIISGSWHDNEASDSRALNYWWGLSAGVVDIIYTQNLAAGTKKLVEFMRRAVESGSFHPFFERCIPRTG